MSNLNKFKVIGIMTGTSMDGLDCSLIETNGIYYVQILKEKTYKYSNNYSKKIKKLIFNLPKNKTKQKQYSKKNEEFITNKILQLIKLFIKEMNLEKNDIDLIGLSGQTIVHNPDKKYTIQLGSGKKIYKKLLIPTISNFRENDIKNGGQGAPIGSYYHRFLLKDFNKKAAIINLGGISNITYSNHKELIAFDMGPANALIDDLMYYFYKKKFDKSGQIAKKGELIEIIIRDFKKDLYFKKKYPKSLDRNYYQKFFHILKKYQPKNAIHTASIMTVISLLKGISLLKKNINLIILTGGGRKNLFIVDNLKKELLKLNIQLNTIDKYGYNGDLVEAQMFGYLAVRSLIKMPLSLPSTTGVKKPLSGGTLNGKLIKN